MTARPLIHGLVQQTMILIAQVATAGGARSPLVRVANQVFIDLTSELQAQGVTQQVIADMFGMALRTYHRRVSMSNSSLTEGDRSVWEAVLEYIREEQPVTGRDIHERFRHDDGQIVIGVLSDLTNTGLTYRAGRGHEAVYRIADSEDFDPDDAASTEARSYLIWQAIYRLGPIKLSRLAVSTAVSEERCKEILSQLTEEGRVLSTEREGTVHYESPSFDVPLGQMLGRDAAILDHFQAMVAALCVKLRDVDAEATGGATFKLDVFPGHPLEKEARGTLSSMRATLTDLRERVDRFNATAQPAVADFMPVVIYLGQYVNTSDDGNTP